MYDILIHLDGTVREAWEIKITIYGMQWTLKIVHLRNGHIVIMFDTMHE